MNDRVETIKSILFEAKALDRYLLSRGIDPRFVSTDQKVSHAKSGEFQKWLRDRKFEEFESEDEVIEEETPQEKFKSGLKKSGYDPDKGAKRLTDLIAKQKKEREEHEKQYGHLYAKEATDYSLVKGQSSNPYNKDVKLSNGYVTKNTKQPKGEYERSVDKYLKKKYNKEETQLQTEEHFVHVSDGSKYGNEPDPKDTEHVIAGIKKHNGKYDGASDKGAYFKFNSKDDAENFKHHVDRCPNRSCHADLHEEVKKPTSQLKDACWTGYTAVGMKMKNGKKVPNCVPTKESFEDEHGISDRKKQSSKSARIIKSIYKKKNMKEDIYDHEKDDKSIDTYGKKPKMSKTDDKAGMGENKPEAAAVMSGGTTLTGEKRDVIEIDPMMRKRPGQPDPTKK